MQAVAYVGWFRNTQVPVQPIDMGCGAGAVKCFECAGSGVWDFAEPEIAAEPCVCCKGTGVVLVSIA